MAQLVTRIDDELVAAVDELVASGAVASRSDAVRAGLRALVDRRRREAAAQATVDAYRRQPQTDEEVEGIAAETAAMIAEEPW
jgi:Arc/MetJ-type ribon-helix-helix transcriptional regulator